MSEPFVPFPSERLRRLEGWGMIAHSMSYVYDAGGSESVCLALETARTSRRSLAPRGSGYSYGDTALNAENVVVVTAPMNRILHWDPQAGVVLAGAGVTIGDLWRATIADGWWPPVVPGTMRPTLGGLIAVNAHGKNHWRAGALAEHVRSLEVLLPNGNIKRVTPDDGLFDALSGSLGLLGIVLTVELQMRKVENGLLASRQFVAPDLAGMFGAFESAEADSDYLVGWIDGFASGTRLGRGLVQRAVHVTDPAYRRQALSVAAQDLPARIAGFVPRSQIRRVMKLLVNDHGMRLLNTGRMVSGSWQAGRTSLVPLAHWHFFLDYVPNFKRAFQPGGILQYQIFVPRAEAPGVFGRVLTVGQDAGKFPYLAVMKRHRGDHSLLGYNVDGYSLALDFHETAANSNRLRRLLQRVTEDIVLPAGGRFYPAKDSILTPHQIRASFGAEAIDRFLAIKARLDPGEVLQTDQYRRAVRPAG